MINFFNDIEGQYKKDLPFVVYRKPDTSELIAWLVESDTLETTVNFEEEGFVFAPFTGPSPSVLFKKSNSNI
jgi:isochorismate synthase